MSSSKKKKITKVAPDRPHQIQATSTLDSPNFDVSPSNTILPFFPDSKPKEFMHSVNNNDSLQQSFFSVFKVVSNIALKEATRQKGHYFLGFGMIFLVVYIISLLITFVYYSPLVFMSIGEMSEGEIDFTLTPSSSNDAVAINYTRIESILPNEIHSPRPNSLSTQIYAATSCKQFDLLDPFNPTYPYTFSSTCRRTENCLSQLCSGSSHSATLYIIDSYREKKATIGRIWPYSFLTQNHVVIDETLAFALGVSKNDYLLIIFPIKSSTFNYHFNQALKQVRISNPSFSLPSYTSSQAVIPVQVHDIVSSPMGKFAITERNFLVMEYPTILNVLARHLHVNVDNVFRNAFDQTSRSLYDHVDSVLFSKSVPRFSTYLTPRFPELARTLLDWGNLLQTVIGPTDTQSSFPVLNGLYNLNQVSLFIDMIIQLVVLFLASLSAFLIYSLLMVSIETKIFQLGILRMIGMTRSVLISMLIIQALFYSIPACFSGLLLSELSFLLLKGGLEGYLRFTFAPFLTYSAVFISLSLAILVPLVSSIAPIRLALSYHLSEALARNRSAINKATVITITHPKNNNHTSFFACMGVILTVFGFSIYYFLPTSLVNNDLVLLFNIFLFIFVCLIIGLVVLADNFIKISQSLVSFLLFSILFMENEAVRALVKSNLLIHRFRNRKTSLLYSLALAFIIFISVTTKIQLDTLQYNYRRIVGADIIVYSSSYYDDGTPASISAVAELGNYLHSHEWVTDFAWQTWSLDKISSGFRFTSLSNIGQIQSFPATIYGVSSNIFDLMDPIFLSPFSSVSPISMLYASKQSNPALLGALFKTSFFLTLGEPLLLSIGTQSETIKTTVHPVFYATSAPVFTMTDRVLQKQDVLVSMPTLLNLTQGRFSSVNDLPLKSCFVKVVPGLSDSQFNRFISHIQSFLTYERIRDIRSTLSVTNDGRKVMDIIFQIASAMIMLFTFFSLNTSMMVNIFEQSKEIGIMRSLGLTKWATFRMYFYESLILVVSSVLLGCCVGAVVAVTMALQQSNLTQVPLDPNFNWAILLTVIGLSLISAFFATYTPVRLIVFKKQLTTLLRD